MGTAVVLYGDGTHDDAAAVQAFLDGEDVTWADGTEVGDKLSGHTFAVGVPIDLTPRKEGGFREMQHCTFVPTAGNVIAVVRGTIIEGVTHG
jgi:hypothetical protein